METPEQAERRHLELRLRAKEVEARAWTILKIDNVWVIALLFVMLGIGVLFYTDHRYAPSTICFRSMNLSLPEYDEDGNWNGNKTMIVHVSSDYDGRNQTLSFVVQIPPIVLMSNVSDFRNWMDYMYENKFSYGFVCSMCIWLQYRLNEGIVRNKLGRFAPWMAFQVFLSFLSLVLTVNKSVNGEEVTTVRAGGVIGFILFRMYCVFAMFDLRKLRSKSELLVELEHKAAQEREQRRQYEREIIAEFEEELYEERPVFSAVLFSLNRNSDRPTRGRGSRRGRP